MRMRALGKTGLTVSELGLGTWGLSGDAYGPIAEADRDEVIVRARAYDVTLFDTADTYARGEMEKALGRLLGADSAAVIVTKLGTDMGATPARKCFEAEYLRVAFEQSRERLRRDALDVVLLHNPAESTVREGEATGVLKALKQSGALRAWGVSAGSAAVASAALAEGAEVIEIAYNVFVGGDLEGLTFDEGSCGVLARSVLAHGLLCGYWSESRVFPRNDHRSERWTTEQLRGRLRQLSAVSAILRGEVTTPRAAALRFALANPRVSSAVLGPRNRVQLDQLVREAGAGPAYLEESQLSLLRAELKRLGVKG
jgi:aryl-alcohol dehydrogenase-like predicted oxidoreductase